MTAVAAWVVCNPIWKTRSKPNANTNVPQSRLICISTSSALASIAYHVAVIIGFQQPFGRIQQYQFIPPRIVNHHATPYLNVERRHDHLSPRRLDLHSRIVGTRDLQVNFRVSRLCVENDLRLIVWHTQTDRLFGFPDQLKPQLVTIERKTGLKARDVEPYTINVLNQRFYHLKAPYTGIGAMTCEEASNHATHSALTSAPR